MAAKARIQSTTSESSNIQTALSTVNQNGPDINVQDQLVKQFSEQSKMNVFYSKQCLEEYGWNLDQAWQVFESMKASGQIPQHAFN